MGSASVQVAFEFPDWLGALETNRARIERVIASTVQTNVGMRFDAEGAHNGHEKWQGLKMRQGQILSLTGALRKSMSPPGAEGNPGPGGFVRQTGDFTGLLTEVGSKLIYAATQNYGAKIKPKNKKALLFLNPGTGKFIFSKEVTIPARNYTDFNAQDEEELNETLANLIAEILSEATV